MLSWHTSLKGPPEYLSFRATRRNIPRYSNACVELTVLGTQVKYLQCV